jgi:hypothetical protein
MVANKGQENLIPMNERSEDEVRELGQKGGIRSGEVRREKATMKATLEMLLNETYKNGKTYRELATLGLLKGAINGNAQNYKTIVEMLGELLQPEESKARVTIINSLPKDDEDESND